VLRFVAGPTRLTVVEGFTIRNGLLNTTGHNYGAGITITNCSPTIRANRVTGNNSDGTAWNYGGGFYISGSNANPLILHNEIDGNELRNGSWNYGAGIHVASGARADIVGNHIHDNRNLTVSSTSTGRGHGAAVYAAGTVLIASNLIVDNLNNTSGWNYGGGVAITSSAIASLFNNTIAGNSVTGGIYRSGGGVYLDSSGSATLLGNIVASNTGHGIFKSSGSGTVTSDYDDVWNNTLANYSGVTAGPNSISVDPLFVSATDRHLTSGSPCVDAMPAGHLTTVVAVDVDHDPRQLDGDLDGGLGDGARLDLGGDEFTTARLSLVGVPRIGTTLAFDLGAAQPSLGLLAFALGRGNTVIAPFGNLLLDTSAVVTSFGVTPLALPFAIPNAPGLRGGDLHGQGLVLVLPAVVAGQFSNLASITLF